MALHNAFGELATNVTLKRVNTAQINGSQKTRIVPASGGGLSVYRNINLAAKGINIKSSAGQIYGWFLFNHAPSIRYVKLYNKASSPWVGHDRPFMTIPLPGGGGANVNFTSGITFAHGIGIGATTGVSDTNSGAPAANDVIVNIVYF